MWMVWRWPQRPSKSTCCRMAECRFDWLLANTRLLHATMVPPVQRSATQSLGWHFCWLRPIGCVGCGGRAGPNLECITRPPNVRFWPRLCVNAHDALDLPADSKMTAQIGLRGPWLRAAAWMSANLCAASACPLFKQAMSSAWGWVGLTGTSLSTAPFASLRGIPEARGPRGIGSERPALANP